MNAVYVEQDLEWPAYPWRVVCDACGECWPFREQCEADIFVVAHRARHGWRHKPREK